MSPPSLRCSVAPLCRACPRPCRFQFWRYNTPTGNAVVDATNDAARKAAFDHWYEGYGKYGVRAMWMDQAEPDHTVYISGGQWKLAKGLDTEVLPAWTYEWSRGFSDKMDELGESEFFLLSRSAWAGTASHGSALWSGDIGSNWGELQTAVTVGQQVGLSGIPLWTTECVPAASLNWPCCSAAVLPRVSHTRRQHR